ncbi:MAG: potassium channel family protein [Actinomycetota bacterium]|jgi:hypothetical protein|nr:potassium channel family protein [Actinomycetota bacterium]
MRRVLRLINEVSLGWLLAALFGTIVLFAIGFWLLALAGSSVLEFTYRTGPAKGFDDALYFSLVTISSLGYGDIRPVGLGRIIAGTEVVVGLAFFGMLVAKISSVKQDYLLRRLYSELVDEKLDRHAETLEKTSRVYMTTSNMLLNGDIDPELTTTFKSDIHEATFFYQLYQQLRGVRNLMVAEEYHGGFFGDVSDILLSRVYAAIQSMINHTMRLLERNAERSCSYILCGNEIWIARVATLADEIACLGAKGSRNADIAAQCRELMELTGRLRNEGLPAIEAANQARHENGDATTCPFDPEAAAKRI